jgi:hypothetical protein
MVTIVAVFTVRNALKQKKQLSIEHAVQRSRTRWHHFSSRNECLVYSNDVTTDKEGSENYGGQSCGALPCLLCEACAEEEEKAEH